MTAQSVERATTADIAAMLHHELQRGLAQYAFNIDALRAEPAVHAEIGPDDLAHLHEARRLVGLLQDHLGSLPSPSSSSTDAVSLTRREVEVLQSVADGLCTAEIATSLHISRNTVRNHVQNILAKLDVHTRLQAVQLAREFGMIRPSTRSESSQHAARQQLLVVRSEATPWGR